jgi:hypothetical protein
MLTGHTDMSSQKILLDQKATGSGMMIVRGVKNTLHQWLEFFFFRPM